MYFYIHKIDNNENEQTQLLEMCHHAGFRSGNGKGVCGIKNKPSYQKVAVRNDCNLFIYKLKGL